MNFEESLDDVINDAKFQISELKKKIKKVKELKKIHKILERNRVETVRFKW